MRSLIFILISTLLQQSGTDSKRPEGWKIRLDRPGFVTAEPYFAFISNGWQISTESPVIAYEPAKLARGNYRLESEILLFPGGQNQGYGLLFGGSSLDSNELAYTSFELRRDGKFSIWSRKGPTTRELVPWTSHAAILPLKGETEPVKNAMAIEVRRSDIVFLVNGRTVYLSGRTPIVTDGNFGFHVSEALNIHANTLSMQAIP
jgi:hypothetical protein